MSIQRAGNAWRGDSFIDLAVYLRQVTEPHPIEIALESTCSCRGTVFSLECDPLEGCARRTCVACGAPAFIGDSQELWENAEPEEYNCPCGGDRFDLGVGFSQNEGGEVRWVIVGCRCVACGALDCAVDWEVDYSPTEHLFEKS